MAADYEQINPYCFLPAIAPHIAAQRAGVTIDISVIAKFYKELAEKAELVIVEGAGGLLVPLNAQRDCADLAKELALPVILVVGMRLGCLNHALLTVEAIAARGLTLSGWVANVLDGDGMTRRCEASGRECRPPASSRNRLATPRNVSEAAMPALQENIEALRERIASPLLGVVPYMTEPDARVAAGQLHLERLEP